MSLLNHLFGSTEAAAKEIEKDDESILKIWRAYSETIPKKANIIVQLRPDFSLKNNVEQLKILLKTGLADIHSEEKKESEIISDLELVEHNQKIKRMQRLEECLTYAETKHKYVHELLAHLYSILKNEMHLVENLLAGSNNPGKLISHLKAQFELEQEARRQIGTIKTESFHRLFLELVKGEHVIKQMDAKEKKLVRRIEKGMNRVFARELTQGITREWALTVFNAIEDQVHESIANETYQQGATLDFELVNRPEFVSLVREVIRSLKKREVSEQMINAFTHIFREWYNHRRD